MCPHDFSTGRVISTYAARQAPNKKKEDNGTSICPPPYDEGTWREVCEIFARMKGLRRIYIFLAGDGVLFKNDGFDNFLEPLFGIKQVPVFEMMVMGDLKLP